ncbi:MAG: haloacid dehalogenase [Desulfurococcaceae archaeon]
MSNTSLNIDVIYEIVSKDIAYVDTILREKDSVREEVIKLTRDIIRLSGDIVHKVHQGRYDEAHKQLVATRELVDKLLTVVEPHPDLKYSGLTYNGLSEYIEAYMFYSIIVEKTIPSLKTLKTPIIPYLQGLGDLVGELRRYIVKLLNELKLKEAELLLEVMEAIYNNLKIIDYPEPLIPGIKHKVDVAFRLLEDTRVLLLHTKNSLRCIEPCSSDHSKKQ